VTAPCLRIAAAAVILAATGTPASATPGSAAFAHVTRDEASRADAAVGRLRELPLPMQPSPRGLPSTKAAPPHLPALESRREHVYAELHALGQASIPALTRALRDPDPEMRRNVAVAMDVVGGGWWQFPDGNSKLDLRPALPALLRALRDSDPGVRAWAAQDISDIGGAAVTAVPGLRTMLRSPDAESRGSACNALGGIGAAAREALPDLRHALDDPSPEVRQAARAAIASVGRAGAGSNP
jgi:HEAT repeat protein